LTMSTQNNSPARSSFPDDLFVWKDTYCESREQSIEPFPVGLDARSIFLINEG
jgi:hypothetical protein